MTGAGQNAANQTGTLGAQNIQNASNFATSGANAMASGTIGSANAIQGGVNNTLNNYLMYDALRRGNTQMNSTSDKPRFL